MFPSRCFMVSGLTFKSSTLFELRFIYSMRKCLFLCCSVTESCLTLCDPWTTACQDTLSSTISWSLLKLMSIESVVLSNCLIFCCPLVLPSIFPTIRVFSNELALRIRQPKYQSFSFSISPSNDYSGVISFRTDCFALLAVQGTQESSPRPQFESISSSVLRLNFGERVQFSP